MRWFRVVVVSSIASCALFPSLDDLTRGDASTADVSASDAPVSDAAAIDADADAAPATDGASEASDASDAATCGWPGPTTGLIAYYPFEEGQGNTIHDCSPNHYDGTFVSQGTGGNWTTGKKGGAIFLQGTNNGCVDFGVHAAFQPTVLSMTAWVNVTAYPTAGGASGYIVGQSLNADVDGWRFASRNGDAGTALGWEHTTSSTRFYVDIPGTPTGAWHHLAVTFINGTMQVFLDGALAKTSTNLLSITYDTAPLRIGCRADDANAFNGTIDEVRLYNRQLSSAEITSLAQ